MKLPSLLSEAGSKLHGFLDRFTTAGRKIDVRPDDTFIVSYPRSGNTWLCFLIANLLRPGDDITFRNLRSVVPGIYERSNRSLSKIGSPRFLTSHEPFDPRYSTVICIVRDPRAVANSLYHYSIRQKEIPCDADWDAFAASFLRGDLNPYGTWAEHVQSWLATRGDDDSFFLTRYEDLLEDPYSVTGDLAKFLSKPIDPSTVRKAVNASRFDRIRKLSEEELREMRGDRDIRWDKKVVRKGKADSWIEEMPSDVARRIFDEFEETAREMGYERNPDGQCP